MKCRYHTKWCVKRHCGGLITLLPLCCLTLIPFGAVCTLHFLQCSFNHISNSSMVANHEQLTYNPLFDVWLYQEYIPTHTLNHYVLLVIT